MTSPEIRELQVFLSLVKTGSFSAAAKQMGITQPAVSAQIAKLEQEIGFPLFYRSPEGTMITDLGKSLVPLVEEIQQEYTGVIRRAAYWKRAQTKEVKIWADGSMIARKLCAQAHGTANDNGPVSHNDWQDLAAEANWIHALKNYEVDIVITGSFLKSGDVPGISTHVVDLQRGITIAWNPAYYSFKEDPISFPDAISSTVILPTSSLALGFREFLSQWCVNAYNFPLDESIECRTEADAWDACKLGLGILIFPGDADKRMKLSEAGLKVARTFEFLLPKAFSFGIRHRAEEQNPHVMAKVEQLTKRMPP